MSVLVFCDQFLYYRDMRVQPTSRFDSHLSCFERDFFADLDSQVGCHLAFNHLNGVRVVIKDTQGSFVWVSDNVPARHGFQTPGQMVGLHDRDINPPALAEVYWRDDLNVLESGKPLLFKTEISFNEAGLPDWFIVNKLPLHNRRGVVHGLIATITPHHGLGQVPVGPPETREVIPFIKANLGVALRLNDLAKLVGLSTRQLQRQFLASTGLTLTEYIVRSRIMEGCRLLRDTEHPIRMISLQVGFYDQSAFNRAFLKYVSIRPLEYRKAKAPLRDCL